MSTGSGNPLRTVVSAAYASAMLRSPGRKIAALLTTTLLSVVPVACGDDQGGAEGSLQAMLGLVPDTEQARALVMYGNLARLRDQPTDRKAAAESTWLLAESKGSYFVSSPVGQRIGEDDFEASVGFGLSDLDASIQAGQPPELLSVFVGRIDPAKVDKALAGRFRKGTHGAAVTYQKGRGDAMDLKARGPLSPVGTGLRLSVADGRFSISDSDHGLTSLLEAADDAAPSLADDEQIAEVAAIVDRAEAFNAILLGDPTRFTGGAEAFTGPAATPELVQRLHEEIEAGRAGLEPWQVAAAADVQGGLLLVLSHADHDVAAQNAERIRRIAAEGMSMAAGQPWSTMLKTKSIDVAGSVVIATFDVDTPMADELVQIRDTLLMIAD